MLCLITYRRLAQGILLLHHYLLLYHPSMLPSLHEFLFNVQNRKYTQALLHCTVHKISFPMSLYFPKSDSGQEILPFYFGDEICPEISERATLGFRRGGGATFSWLHPNPPPFSHLCPPVDHHGWGPGAAESVGTRRDAAGLDAAEPAR
jgi:hypothetical protein